MKPVIPAVMFISVNKTCDLYGNIYISGIICDLYGHICIIKQNLWSLS